MMYTGCSYQHTVPLCTQWVCGVLRLTFYIDLNQKSMAAVVSFKAVVEI